MAQFLVPVSDQATGSWTNAPLWSKTDADDNTDAISEAVGNNTDTSNADLKLDTGADPEVSTGHTLRARWHHDTNGRSLQATAELFQGDPAAGGTLIATLTSATNVGTTEVENTHTLTGTEADAITDYSDLYVRLRGRGTGGGPGRALHVDLVELEIPDATPDAPRAGQISFAELETPDTPSGGGGGVPVPESFTPTDMGASGTTFNMPATRPDDDLYILHLFSDARSAVTAPSGWNAVAELEVSNTAYLLVAWRIGDSEPATYDVGGGPEDAIGVVTRYSGIDTADPINQAATPAAGTSTFCEAPAVTPDIDNTLIARFYGSDGATFSSIPDTELYDEMGTDDARAAQSYEDGPSSGNSSNAAVAVLSSSDEWGATTLAIAPDPSGGGTDRSGQVSFAELEVADAPRQGQISFAELETPDAARAGQISHAELETTDAPRQGQVSHAELEAPLAPRQGQVSFAELETGDAPRQGQISFAEFETEDAARAAQTSWAELEVPTAPSQGQISHAVLETPDAPTTDRRSQISFAELETEDAARSGQVSFAEFETEDAPRSGQVSFAELETEDAPRAGQVSWAELETGDAPRTGQISFAELETENAPRKSQISFAELETADAARRAQVSTAEFETPEADRSGQLSFAVLETPDAPSTDRRSQVSFAALETTDAPRSGQISFAEMQVDEAPRRAEVSHAEMETEEAPRSAQLSHAALEAEEAPRSVQLSFAELETDEAPRSGELSFAELETPDAARAAQVSFAELETDEAPRSGQVAWATLETPNKPGDSQAHISWAEFEAPDYVFGYYKRNADGTPKKPGTIARRERILAERREKRRQGAPPSKWGKTPK